MAETAVVHNPFPYQGAQSLEGRVDLDGRPDERVFVPPTLLVPAMEHARDLVKVWLRRHGSHGGPRGQVILLRGEHGSGKTHTIRYAMQHVATRMTTPFATVGGPLQLYVKAEDEDFLGIYRRLMAQLSLGDLQDLAVRYLGVVAGEAVTEDRADPAVGARTRVDLEQDPELVYRLFQEYFIEASAVWDRQGGEVRQLTRGRDFQRALGYLTSPELAGLSYEWLRGRQLDDAHLARLGVSGSISTPETARIGLQLLATLAGRIGRPLLIYVDQYERLLLAGKQVVEANVGLLRNLTEVLPREDALLLVAGNPDAWEALPPDLQDRFGLNLVHCSGLELEEATALIQVYLHPDRVAPDGRTAPEQADVEPLTPQAIRLAHLYSGGNVRRMLQLCAAAFDASPPGTPRIDDSVVREVARRREDMFLDPAGVLTDAAVIARRRGLDVEDDRPFGLLLLKDGHAVAKLILGAATHYSDELREASRSLDAVEEHRLNSANARTLLLLLGYVSAEVRETLRPAVDHLIEYRRESFAQDFGAALGQVLAPGREARSGEPDFATVRQTLRGMEVSREPDAEQLARGTEELARAQERARLADRWAAARADWVVARGALEQRMSDARESRLKDDLAELERLRAKAEDDRRARLRARLALPVVLIGALLFVFVVLAAANNDLGAGVATTLALALVATGAGLAFYAYTIDRRPTIVRELAAPVSSVEELRRLAYRLAREQRSVDWLLREPNPQMRFAASAVPDPDELAKLRPALAAERARIVRRAFAQQIGRRCDPEDIAEALQIASRSDTPEYVYVLDEALARGLGLPGEPLPPEGAALRDLVAVGHDDPASPAVRALGARLTSGPDAGAGLKELDAAFQEGLPPTRLGVLRGLSPVLAQEAARRVSPFERGGLGTFDELRALPQVDQAFLLLSQFLFISERGLLAGDADALG